MVNKLSWDKRLRRIEFRPPYTDPEQLTGYLKEMDANMLVSSAMEASTGYSLYPSDMSPMSKSVNADYMASLIRLCHESDIMVICWYSPRENTVVWNNNPQWRMMIKENDNDKEHWFKDTLCYISSPYKEWLCRHLEEIVARFDIEGLFLDGATIGWYYVAAGCYCDWCKRAFFNDTGFEIPQKIEWGTPATDFFIRWRYDKYNEWLLNLKSRLLRIKHDLVIELNVLNRPHIRNEKEVFDWKSGINLHTLPVGISSGSESDCSIYRLCSTTQTSAHSRAMDPISWNLWMPALNFAGERRKGICLCDEAPSVETFKIHAALVMSRGGIPWYGVDILSQTKRDKIKETFEFIRKRETCSGDILVKDIAIHMSQSARDYYGKHDAERYFEGVLGFFEAAVEMHYLVDFILDDQLNIENMSKYRVLMLSNSACLTKDQVDDIYRFVKNGGILVVTHFSALLDENNRIMDNFAFADLIGADFEKFMDDPSEDCIIRYNDQNPICDEVSILNGASYISVKVPDKSSIEVLATIGKCDSTQESLIPNETTGNYFKIPERKVQKPIIVHNKYGDGDVFYCGFDIGSAYLHNPFTNTRKIIEFMINGRNNARIRLFAPKSLEFSAMESSDGKKLYIHVVNAPATCVKSPGWHSLMSIVDEVQPVYGIVAEIRDRVVKKAVNALTGRHYEVRQVEAGYTIQFDCNDIHEIILVSE